MNPKCPSTGLSQKSQVSHSFAQRSFKSLLSIKGQTSQHWKTSLNPTRGKGPPGPARSPGEEHLSSTVIH
jgi:hypothetical protein